MRGHLSFSCTLALPWVKTDSPFTQGGHDWREEVRSKLDLPLGLQSLQRCQEVQQDVSGSGCGTGASGAPHLGCVSNKASWIQSWIPTSLCQGRLVLRWGERLIRGVERQTAGAPVCTWGQRVEGKPSVLFWRIRICDRGLPWWHSG